MQYRVADMERKYRVIEAESALSVLAANARKYPVFGQLLSVVAESTNLPRERVREIANKWPSLWAYTNTWS